MRTINERFKIKFHAVHAGAHVCTKEAKAAPSSWVAPPHSFAASLVLSEQGEAMEAEAMRDPYQGISESEAEEVGGVEAVAAARDEDEDEEMSDDEDEFVQAPVLVPPPINQQINVFQSCHTTMLHKRREGALARGDPNPFAHWKSSALTKRDTVGEPAYFSYGNLHCLGRLKVAPGEGTRKLAETVVNGWNLGFYSAFSETKPPGNTFRMFIDYDLVWGGEPNEAVWAELEKMEKDIVRSFWPGIPATDRVFQSTVCTSGFKVLPPKEVPQTPEGRAPTTSASGAVPPLDRGGPVPQDTRPTTILLHRVKTGIHVYYPYLYVTAEVAKTIVATLAYRAKCAWPDTFAEQWGNMVDAGPYNQCALRWVYQFKAVKCACESTRRVGPGKCGMCGGAGVVPDLSASMYAPAYRVDGTGTRRVIPGNPRMYPTVALMLECSLRQYCANEVTAGFVLPPDAVPVPDRWGGTAALTATGAATAKKKPRNPLDEFEGEDPSVALAACGKKRGRVLETYASGSPEFQVVEQTIRECPQGRWAHASLRNLKKYQGGKGPGDSAVYYTAGIEGEGAGFCLNIKASHRHCRVWFLIKPGGLEQRCPNTKEVPGTGRTCAQFHSGVLPLTHRCNRILFDTAAPLIGPATQCGFVPLGTQLAMFPPPALPFAGATTGGATGPLGAAVGTGRNFALDELRAATRPNVDDSSSSVLVKSVVHPLQERYAGRRNLCLAPLFGPSTTLPLRPSRHSVDTTEPHVARDGWGEGAEESKEDSPNPPSEEPTSLPEPHPSSPLVETVGEKRGRAPSM